MTGAEWKRQDKPCTRAGYIQCTCRVSGTVRLVSSSSSARRQAKLDHACCTADLAGRSEVVHCKLRLTFVSAIDGNRRCLSGTAFVEALSCVLANSFRFL